MKKKSNRKRNQRILIILTATLVVILIVYSLTAITPNYITIPTHTPASSLDVPKIGPNTKFYADWFVHLDIFINGTKVQVPGDLGHISANTLYAIHTDDVSGTIHIQTPTFNDYNLSEIFEIWGYPTFTSSQIFNYTGTSVKQYVYGALVPTDGNYPLLCHSEIAIIVGSYPHTIPSSYNFGSDSCIA